MSRLTRPRVGLRVNTQESYLLACFSQDVYTPREGGGEPSALQDAEFCDRWDRVESLPNRDTYREAVILRPVYEAVVYREGGEADARALAGLLGLPCEAFRG